MNAFRLWDLNEKHFIDDKAAVVIKRDGTVLRQAFGSYKSMPHLKLVGSTGLLDYNKKVVHEGDILKHVYCTLIPWIVVRRSFSFAVYHPNRHEYYSVYDEEFFNERKVVGNIYENPELLKEEEEIW